MTTAQAMAALHSPGYLEIGEPDIAATIAEYGGAYEQWPCDEWDWTANLRAYLADGKVIDLGPHAAR